MTHPNPSDKQPTFDTQQRREKQSLAWLKQQQTTIKKPLRHTALAGCGQGFLVIAQMALLANALHQLIIAHRAWQDLTDIWLGLITIVIARSALLYLAQTQGFAAAAQIKQELRHRLLEQFARQTGSHTFEPHSGSLASIVLEQTEALEGYFSRYLPQKTIAAVVPVSVALTMLPVNWPVAVIFFITGPLLLWFMVLIGLGAAAVNRQQFLELRRMSGYFLDRLQGLTTLKLLGRFDAEMAAIAAVSQRFSQKTMRVLRIAFLSSASLEFFSAISVALVAVYVGLGLLGLLDFAPARELDLQQALLALLLAPEFFAPIKQLAAFYHDRAAAIAAAESLIPLLEIPQQPAATLAKPPCPTTAFIEFRAISKSYRQRQVLNAIDWQINAGETWLIHGESGAGKTTLLKLLLGFEAADSGDIYLQGQQLTRDLASQHIAWAGQHPQIFHGSLLDNIRLFDETVSLEQVNAAATAAGVTAFSQYLPQGLMTQVGDKGYGLSGGQLQRVALARLFLKNAPIVVLDEPTAHLDAANKAWLWQSIKQLFAEKTLIVVSHDAWLCDRIERQRLLQGGVLR